MFLGDIGPRPDVFHFVTKRERVTLLGHEALAGLRAAGAAADPFHPVADPPIGMVFLAANDVRRPVSEAGIYPAGPEIRRLEHMTIG